MRPEIQMSRVGFLVATILVLGASGPLAGAQDQLAVRPQPERLASNGPVPEVLRAPAGITVEGLPLEEALLLLDERAEVTVAFSPSFLPRNRRVTCSCEGVSIAEALDRLLAGTPLAYSVIGSYVVIEGRPESGGVEEPGSRTTEMLTRNGEIRPSPVRPQLRVRNPHRRQTGTVVGQVIRTEAGGPLPGAQVSITGSNLAVLTDGEGRYRIERVPAGEVTVHAQAFAFAPATRTVTLAADQTVTVDFELREQALALDELVVTGQAGQARRREVGNAVAQLRAADIAEPVRSVENMIQGRVSGARVTFPDAAVGSGPAIRLRGNVSVTQGNQPIVYIDGVRQSANAFRGGGRSGNVRVSSPLADINPEDIERVEIVKGAAASTLVGSDAAAGVIQIFTHRGRQGAPQFSYRTDQTVSWVRPWGSDERPRLNMDPWLRAAYGQRHALSVRGGMERFQYFISGNVESRDGPQVDEEEDRYTVRMNATVHASETLSLDATTTFSHHDFQTAPQGNALASIFFNVYRAPNNFVGGALPGDPEFEDQIDRLRGRTAETVNQRLNLGLTGTWSPLEDASIRATIGYDRLQQDQMVVEPFAYVTNPRGAINVADWFDESLTLNVVSNYQLRLSDNLRTTLSAGGEWIQRETQTFTGSGEGLPGPGRHTLSSTAVRNVAQSGLRLNTGGFFVQGMFNIADRLFLTGGTRVDGSSAFGTDFGLQVYPKASASWVISEEGFWPRAWGDMRLRAAFGFAGRSPGAFDAVRTFQPESFRGQTAFSPANVGNPNLGPERTGELEVGFDGSFMDGRVDVDLTFYRQITREALLNVGQAPSLGFGGGQLENVGKIRNRGVELGVDLTVLDRPGLVWTVGTDIATNNSKILDDGGAGSFTIVEGQPAPVMRQIKVLNPNEFADPVIERDAFFGPTEPTLILGFDTSVELPRGILVTARGERLSGHYVNDFASNLMAQRTGPGALGCDEVYRIIPHDRSYLGPGDTHPNLDQVRALDRARCFTRSEQGLWTFPADFFKLREITVQAPLPWAIRGTESVLVTASVQNLFRVVNSEFASHDPETRGAFNQIESLTGGAITDNVPPPATFTFSIRATF